MSNYTIQRLKIVQYNINHINKITYEAQDQLEANKNNLLDQIKSTSKTTKPSDETDEKFQMKIKELTTLIEDIEKNIDSVQNEHDLIMSELEKKKHTLRKRVATLKKLENFIKVLTYKIFDEQQEFYQKIEIFNVEKEETLQRVDLQNLKPAKKAAKIDKQIKHFTNMHDERIFYLEEQRNELRKEFVIKAQSAESTVDAIKAQHNAILNELHTLKSDANQFELAEISRRIVELNRLHQIDINIVNELQHEVWKDVTDEEKISKRRHLQVTISDQIENNFTSGSSCLCFLEETNVASCSELLKESVEKTESLISVTSSERRRLQVTTSDQIENNFTSSGSSCLCFLEETNVASCSELLKESLQVTTSDQIENNFTSSESSCLCFLEETNVASCSELLKESVEKTESSNSVTSSERRRLQVTTSDQIENNLTSSESSCLCFLEETNVASCSELLKESVEKTESLNSVTYSSVSKHSQMESEDVQYLKALFGKPLSLALAEITMKQPRDPINYLGNWLFKYRYNQETSLSKKKELQQLISERERIEMKKLHEMIECEAITTVLNMITQAEEEAIRNELERIAREAMEVEETEYDSESQDVVDIYNGPTVNTTKAVRILPKP